MAISKNLKNCVLLHDIDGIRDCLFFATAQDPGFQDDGAFNEALQYCISNGITDEELYQDDNGEELPTEMTQENMAKICGSLGTNFSKRKINAARTMGKILFPEETNKQKESNNSQKTSAPHNTEKRTYSRRREPEHNSSSVSAGVIIIGAAAVVAAVVGIVIIATRR